MTHPGLYRCTSIFGDYNERKHGRRGDSNPCMFMGCLGIRELGVSGKNDLTKNDTYTVKHAPY